MTASLAYKPGNCYEAEAMVLCTPNGIYAYNLTPLLLPPLQTPPYKLGSATRSSDALLLFSPLEFSRLPPRLPVPVLVGRSASALQLTHLVVVQ